MTQKLAIVDIETTGLDPVVHEPWEVGLILRKGGAPAGSFHWFLPVDLSRADPHALRVGRFHDRFPGAATPIHTRPTSTTVHEFAATFARLTRDAHLVTATGFDERRLWDLLRAGGQCPMWHHRSYEVQSMVAGHLRQPIRGLRDSAIAMGIDPDGYELHTALGDAALTRDVFDAVMGTEATDAR